MGGMGGMGSMAGMPPGMGGGGLSYGMASQGQPMFAQPSAPAGGGLGGFTYGSASKAGGVGGPFGAGQSPFGSS